jgi:spermidine/putrescine transport system ATP-binding protein
MSSGRILQIGSPSQIYDRPAERFVAAFIGETNFLQADIVSVNSERATVRLPSNAVISATLPAAASPAGKVTIVVRPEHARAVKADGDAMLSGVVENVVYLGTDTHIHIRLADGTPFVVRQQNSGSGPSGFAPGDKAGIALSADVAQILKD